ncbi:MAG: 30S ribosomal protein S9 [Thermoprotei archaeon]|nr:MAG: 30S ribosomal protein S9 [Thermoprotei archaeon]HDJ95031.1 30S ribosomal protein S9 [Acidilobales archaeon]
MKIIITSGKRKTAIARAVFRPGKGRVYINNIPLELYPIEMARWKMMEPLLLAGKDVRSKIDIKVNVKGGGVMAQADAVRMAIARGLIEWTGSEELKKLFLEYDKTMLSGDPRQTEPKKFARYSARRRWQKSYR